MLPFPIKICPVEIFIRATPGSPLVSLYKHDFEETTLSKLLTTGRLCPSDNEQLSKARRLGPWEVCGSWADLATLAVLCREWSGLHQVFQCQSWHANHQGWPGHLLDWILKGSSHWRWRDICQAYGRDDINLLTKFCKSIRKPTLHC